ncbi:MAG: hypothetical protein KAX13_08775, partial [Candidatus Krumholzibacteria bacterium]|nr:hypothetical protein [Candidatus Krumholzibacteria bacterium]
MRNVDLEGKVTSFGGEISFSVSEGSAESLTRNAVVRSLSGEMKWNGGRGSLWELADRNPVLELIGLRVEMEESALTFNGTIQMESTQLDLLVDAEPIEVEEVARALDVETDHFGELQGSFTLRGAPDSVRVEGALSGIFSGYALSDLDVDITVQGDRIDIARAAGGFNGALVTGSGSYTFDAPEILTLDIDVRDMDLSEGFVPGRDLPETFINGRLKLGYRFEDGSVFFDADLDEGHLREMPFDRALIKGSYIEENLHVDRVLL